MNSDTDNFAPETSAPAKRRGLRWFTVERFLLLVLVALQVMLLIRVSRNERIFTRAVAELRRERMALMAQNPLHAQPHAAFPQDMEDMDPTDMMQALNTLVRSGALQDEMPEAFGMQAQMGRMLKNALGGMRDLQDMEALVRHFDQDWNTAMPAPAMDMREDANGYTVLVCLPNIRPSDLNVSLQGRLLTVAAANNEGLNEEVSEFTQQVLLPGPVGNATAAQAAVTNGVLRITLPKTGTPQDKPERIRVL